MKVHGGIGNLEFNVYPNPATAGNLKFQLVNQKAGLYEVRLVNSFGRIFMARTIQHKGGSSLENIRPEVNIPKGIYRLEIKTPAGNRQVISLVF
ncbi:MAG: T9SS type A sorting domain-containing protein [Ginsengibacter sp.]